MFLLDGFFHNCIVGCYLKLLILFHQSFISKILFQKLLLMSLQNLVLFWLFFPNFFNNFLNNSHINLLTLKLIIHLIIRIPIRLRILLHKLSLTTMMQIIQIFFSIVYHKFI